MEKRIEDNPAFPTFPTLNTHPNAIPYSEEIFVGYRGYQKNQVQPLFPFGFGLSYTNFSFSNLNLEPAKLTGSSDVTVTFTVTNTGNRAGAEVAQLYVGQQNPTINRPIRELKGFQKIFLQPGQSQKVTLTPKARKSSRSKLAEIGVGRTIWSGTPNCLAIDMAVPLRCTV